MDIRDLTVVSSLRRADELASVLGCEFELPGEFPGTSNILIYGGFYDDLTLAERLTTYLPDREVYVLFTGVDVCELQEALLNDRLYCAGLFEILKRVKILTVGRPLQEELKQFGLDVAATVILPVDVDCELDEKRSVVAYVPKDRFYSYLYRVGIIERLAKETEILTYGARGGWYDDATEIYRKALLNIRLTRHDGQPYDVIAMAQMGIQSVVSYCDFPYMISVANSDSDDVMYGMALTAIQNYKPDAGEIEEMKAYYRKKYSPENSRKSFERI